MSTDDKYGIGAGLLALGLAAGIILLGQLTFNKKAEDAMTKAATDAHDSGKPQTDTADQPSLLYRIIPHRELVIPEAVFDGIVCALALPAGIFFFASALASRSPDREAEDKKEAKQA
jgi:hypothetical protein